MPELQIRAGQRLISINLQPSTAHIYHVMIIVTGGFSKKSLIYQYYFYFLEILLNYREFAFMLIQRVITKQRVKNE